MHVPPASPYPGATISERKAHGGVVETTRRGWRACRRGLVRRLRAGVLCGLAIGLNALTHADADAAAAGTSAARAANIGQTAVEMGSSRVTAPTVAAQWGPTLSARAEPGSWQSAIERVSGAWAALPGGRFALRVDVALKPGWHTYWQNPGDSGDAPAFAWTLPAGWTAHEVLYPRPEAKILDELPFFGYEGRATYVVVIAPNSAATAAPGTPSAPTSPAPTPAPTPADAPAPAPAPMPAPASTGTTEAASHRWKVVATMLACKERCVLGTFELEGSWPPVSADGPMNLAQERFDGRMLPVLAADAGVTARLQGEMLHIEGPAQGRPSVRFIPESAPGLVLGGPAAAKGFVPGTVRDDRFVLDVPLERTAKDETGALPDAAGLVLLGERPGDPAIAVRVSSGKERGGAREQIPASGAQPGSQSTDPAKAVP